MSEKCRNNNNNNSNNHLTSRRTDGGKKGNVFIYFPFESGIPREVKPAKDFPCLN